MISANNKAAIFELTGRDHILTSLKNERIEYRVISTTYKLLQSSSAHLHA